MQHYYYIPYNLNANIHNDATTGGNNGARLHPAGGLRVVPAGETPAPVRKRDGTIRSPQRITRREAYAAYGAEMVELAREEAAYDYD